MVNRSLFTPGGIDPASPVPIDCEKTVPTVQMATLLAQLCDLDSDCTAIEIGTGSGYQAAVLAEQCRQVVTFEVKPYLGDAARWPRVKFIHGDGCTLAGGADVLRILGRVDALLASCAVPTVFPAWLSAVKEGGRVVIPFDMTPKAPIAMCAIMVYRKGKEGTPLEFQRIAAYAPFTRLIGGR